jgi:hypothetical protein
MMTDEMVDELALAFGWHHVDADGMEYHFTFGGLRDLLSMPRIPPKDVLEAMTASRKALKAAHNLSRSNAPQPEAATAACQTCDGTGDVHDQTGEYRGACTACAAVQPEAAQPDWCFDDGSSVCISGMAGGAHPGGFLATVTVTHTKEDGSEDRIDFVRVQPAPMPVAIDEQETFEAFAKDKFFDLDSGEHGYKSWPTQMAWHVWQETRRAALPLPAQQVAEQKDAERYQWLRDNCISRDMVEALQYHNNLDELVDAAMTAGGQEK